MLEIKSINRIVRVMGCGMSCPIHIVADDNKSYILKTKITRLNDESDKLEISVKELFAEIFSYLYLKELKASYTPNICLLDVTDETLKLTQKFANANEREKQALQNLKNSKGLNLGVEFIENANKVVEHNFSDKFIKETINYDARLMNTDRDKENPNILQDVNDKKWLIDFGLAFDTLALFDNLTTKTTLIGANEVYFNKCCFGTYIFNEITRKNVALMRKSLSLDTIKNIINYTCDITNLLNDDDKEYLTQIIDKRQTSKRIFCA